jgi:hypothetical protein
MNPPHRLGHGNLPTSFGSLFLLPEPRVATPRVPLLWFPRTPPLTRSLEDYPRSLRLVARVGVTHQCRLTASAWEWTSISLAQHSRLCVVIT